MTENKLAILALTEKLYVQGKQQVASGQQVSQENMATLNRARQQIARSRAQYGLPPLKD
jgi:hypothetical protein